MICIVRWLFVFFRGQRVGRGTNIRPRVCFNVLGEFPFSGVLIVVGGVFHLVEFVGLCDVKFPFFGSGNVKDV